MKKLYVRSIVLLAAVAIILSVVWFIFVKMPKMIKNNEDYKACVDKCHPNLVEQYTPCVCDTRYQHGG